jgi:hypothetical protein
MTYTFKDRLQNVTITIMSATEDEAWMDLADNYGSGYVLENIEYLGRNIID